MSNPKRVLITGANKGIGRALVGAVLSEDEDTVVLLGSRDRARGDAARDALIEDKPSWAERIVVVALDVSDDASVVAAAETIAAMYSTASEAPLSGIVNNAGIGFHDYAAQDVLNVNTYGPYRVCQAFIPLLDPHKGRIVNVSSASGPTFVAACSAERQRMFIDPEVTWAAIEAEMDAFLEIHNAGGDVEKAGFGSSVYGLSKACLNAYTLLLAREHPALTVNGCTPGFIETDMTRTFAQTRGVSPNAMGMKPPEAGTHAVLYLLFGQPGGSGWYFGSDALRSPLDRYRSPGDPPYTPSA
ncbi:MAG: SDR family NAD(P)-dependent oxidoreductase [Myxococcota bacterium]